MVINEDGLAAASGELENLVKRRVSGSENIAKGVIEAYFDNVDLDHRIKLRDGSGSGVIRGTTTKYELGWVEGYITVNCFPNGQPGEVFLHGAGKDGSTISGLMDLIAILISVGLQYGVPLNVITTFMRGMTFEPNGIEAKSIPDLIGTFLEEKYGTVEENK